MRRVALAFAVLVLFCTSCSVMCTKKHALKGTKWVAEYKIFVADAGNENVTATLSFLPSGKYTIHTVASMPSYPAMHMNADGTVDTMPGYTREYTQSGTYTFSDNLLVLTSDDGGRTEMKYTGDAFVCDRFDGYLSCSFKKEK